MAAPIAFEPPSIQKAWQAFLQHIPVVLVSWVGSIVLSLLAVLAYGLIIVAVSAIIGSSDAALGLGAVLAQLVQLPFSILASLLSVLLVAVPALYYERGEVVTISTAAQLLTGRWWRYVLAGLFLFADHHHRLSALHPSRDCRGVGDAGVRESHLRHRYGHR